MCHYHQAAGDWFTADLGAALAERPFRPDERKLVLFHYPTSFDIIAQRSQISYTT